MKSSKGNILGGWAFLIGVVLAVILGGLNIVSGSIPLVLMVLGLIVGLLNVTSEEVQPFLMAGTVLVIVSGLGGNALSTISWFKNILDAMLLLFVPATIVVALKSVFSLAKR